MNYKPTGKNYRECPKCGDKESLVRVRRDFFDRFVSKFVFVRRYQCYYCHWEGLMRVASRTKKKKSNLIMMKQKQNSRRSSES